MSIKSAVIIAMTAFISGCTVLTPPPPFMASTMVPNSEIVGAVDGESSAYYIFGFGPFGDSTLKTAIKDALSKRGGDTLTNVASDNSVRWFGLGGSWIPMLDVYYGVTTKVYGTAIRYKK